MNLEVLMTKKDWTGLIDITVRIDGGKEYTFTLPSQYDLEYFEKMRKRTPGAALNYLKRVEVK